MFSKIKTLRGYTLRGLDGEIGKVEEFFFDDKHWAVRYLVVDTGSWLSGREVLISPYALGMINWDERDITVGLTRKQIEESPPIDTDKPVSRQYEQDYYGFYGWPLYWDGPYMWGAVPYIERNPEMRKGKNEGGKSIDPHLRSTRAVSAYYVQANDGELGHVDDFIVDDQAWAIRYLVVGTRNWWPGKKVLISPQWIERVSWKDSKVFISLSQEAIKMSPEYSEEALLTREYETGLHKHYSRKGYWIEDAAAKVPVH